MFKFISETSISTNIKITEWKLPKKIIKNMAIFPFFNDKIIKWLN